MPKYGKLPPAKPYVVRARKALAAGQSKQDFIDEQWALYEPTIGTAFLMNSPELQRRLLERGADIVFGSSDISSTE